MTPKFQAPNTKTLRAPALQGPPSPLPTPLPQSCCVSSDGPRLDQRDCLGNWTWQEGSEQTLKCAARGNPIPKLNCSRKGDGASLPIGDLKPVTREVAGTYLCWATSARGGVTREVVLNVLCEFEFWDGQGRGNLASSTLTAALCLPHRRPEYPGHCHSGGSCDPHLGHSGHRWLYLQLPAEDPEIRAAEGPKRGCLETECTIHAALSPPQDRTCSAPRAMTNGAASTHGGHMPLSYTHLPWMPEDQIEDSGQTASGVMAFAQL